MYVVCAAGGRKMSESPPWTVRDSKPYTSVAIPLSAAKRGVDGIWRGFPASPSDEVGRNDSSGSYDEGSVGSCPAGPLLWVRFRARFFAPARRRNSAWSR